MSKVAQSVLTKFGEAVKRARALKGWQLKELSQEMRGNSGISFLSDIEKGKRSISGPTVGKLINALNLDETWIDQFLDSDTSPEGEQTAADRIADKTLELVPSSDVAQKLVDAGITENAIIALAQRIAGDTDDVGQAWLQLQNAMDIAVRVQAEGKQHSNHGDFVDTVLAQVADLAKDGDYTSASATIRDALAQADAQKSRLLATGAEVALLDADTAAAAALLVCKADVDAGGIAELKTLHALQNRYHEIGRDKGSNLDSVLAIDLAHLILARAETPEERGAVGNNLGNSLAVYGARKSNTIRLEQSITAFTQALKERTRDRVPLDWAMTQMNLGSSLKILGERESSTDRLEQSVTAFTAALKERTRDRVPLDWAMTQMNLGNALASLGEREIGTGRFEQAVTAHTEALKENTRDRDPMLWAMTQMNLGNALRKLGERELGTGRLEQAVAAYTEALKEITRDRAPMQWAQTKLNLGNALSRLGERESSSVHFAQAVVAYTEALKENTRDRDSMQWAMAQGNLAGVEVAFFDNTNDPAHLDRAAGYANAAREVFVEAQASQYVIMIDQNIAAIQFRRS
ncbi:MAG: helix-turn-helix transcriptional regulator [Litoreibacter sp.]|uniref:helix-turn-helix transcriptional regulator n=1 Tax=Litoreibacter sp. TaxID=1969459 RepID=UPI003297E474